MESKENELVVDTRGYCFICLNHTTFISEENQEKQPDSVQSIQYLFLSSYLKLDRGKVFQGPVQQHLLEKVERSRLKVELCPECSTLNDKLTKLFEQLERIEMEVAFRLSSLSDKISCSEEAGLMELIKKMLETSTSEPNVDYLEKLEIAQLLREETNRKCSIKSTIFNSTPKVRIQEINLEKLIYNEKIIVDKFEQEIVENIKTENASSPTIKGDNDTSDDDDCQDYDMNAPPEDNYYGYSSPSSQSSSTKTPDVKEEPVNRRNLTSRRSSSSSVTKKTKGKIFSKTTGKNKLPLATVPPPVKSGEINNPTLIASKKMDYLDNGRRKCRICSNEYFDFRNFFRHFESAHMNVSYTCPVPDCGKTFSQRGSYETHYKSLHLRIRYRCKICKLALTRKAYLISHFKRAHKYLSPTVNERENN